MSTEITNWLRGLGLEQYASAFEDNAIDAGVLPELTADDLKDLGVNLVGHRRKLLAAIAALRDQASPAETRSASAPSLPLIPNDAGPKSMWTCFSLVESSLAAIRPTFRTEPD